MVVVHCAVAGQKAQVGVRGHISGVEEREEKEQRECLERRDHTQHGAERRESIFSETCLRLGKDLNGLNRTACGGDTRHDGKACGGRGVHGGEDLSQFVADG